MDITENVEEIKDEDMMDEDDADDDSSEESSGDEVSDNEDVVKDKTEKGRAHQMFLRFMNPQICDFFYKNVFVLSLQGSSFCFVLRSQMPKN